MTDEQWDRALRLGGTPLPASGWLCENGWLKPVACNTPATWRVNPNHGLIYCDDHILDALHDNLAKKLANL